VNPIHLSDVLLKRENLDINKHIGSISCEDEDRDWDPKSVIWWTPNIARKSPDTRSKVWNRFLVTVLRMGQCHQGFQLELLSLKHCYTIQFCYLSHISCDITLQQEFLKSFFFATLWVSEWKFLGRYENSLLH
jgi:hypothetical protein